MQPLTFGRSSRPLFGLYQPPETSGPARAQGVVLCNPIGAEYIPAYPSMKQLSGLLCRSRFPVLRFDWFGTGDSAGDTGEGELEEWMENLEAAADELKDTAQVREVSVVGLRLGASIAATVGARRSDFARMVLWEPVVEGRRYLDDLNAMQDAYLERVLPRPTEAITHGARREVLGYAPGRAFLAGLTAMDLLQLPEPPARELLVLDRFEERSHRRLAEQLRAKGAAVQYSSIPAPRIWVKGEDDAVVHPETMQAILHWLEREPR